MSATHGLAGAADTITVLVRQRGTSDGVLKITGRDIPEAEYAMSLTDGVWTLDGDTLAAAAAAAAAREEELRLGDRSIEILTFVRRHPDNTPKKGVTSGMIAECFGEVRIYLSRLVGAGRLLRSGRGHYHTPVPTVPSVPSPPSPQVRGLPGLEHSQQGGVPSVPNSIEQPLPAAPCSEERSSAVTPGTQEECVDRSTSLDGGEPRGPDAHFSGLCCRCGKGTTQRDLDGRPCHVGCTQPTSKRHRKSRDGRAVHDPNSHCAQCGKTLEGKILKARFCSNKCKDDDFKGKPKQFGGQR